MDELIEKAKRSLAICLRNDVTMFLPAGFVGIAAGFLAKNWISEMALWKQLLIQWFSGGLIGFLLAALICLVFFRNDWGLDSPATLIRTTCTFISAQAACLTCFSTGYWDASAIPITLACIWGIPMGVTCEVNCRPLWLFVWNFAGGIAVSSVFGLGISLIFRWRFDANKLFWIIPTYAIVLGVHGGITAIINDR